jgi:gluconolactonase
MSSATVIATGLQFPEGPAIDREGVLHVVEIAGQRVTRVLDDGTTEVFATTGGGPNGCAFGPDGRLYVCNNGGRWPTDVASTATSGRGDGGAGCIQAIALDGTVETVLAEVDGEPLHAPNDICFDADGGYYFTDPVWGSAVMERTPGHIVHVDADGSAQRAHTGLQFPNGLGVTDDGRFLVVCESMTGMLWGFKIGSGGALDGDPRPNGHIGRRSIPDGFCFDSDGNMIVAGHQTNCLFVHSGSDGRPIRTVELDDAGPTNVCFGGPDFRTLYVTSSDVGQVLALEWPVPGMRLFPDRR